MKKIEIGAFLFTLFAVTLVYVNHFDNAFHFDDSHALVISAGLDAMSILLC